jgi:hypothetical protein
VGSVEEDACVGFRGSWKSTKPACGQGEFALVADDEADEVVAAAVTRRRRVSRAARGSRDEEGDGAAADDVVEVFEGGGEIGVRGGSGRAARISEMTRRTWGGPLREGRVCFSTRSVKRISPTRSWLAMAEKARTAADFAARGRA